MMLHLEDEELRLIVQRVAKDPDGFKLLGHLISSSGALCPGFNSQNLREDDMQRGRSLFGFEIVELMKRFALTEYLELIKEGVKKEYDDK